MGWSLQSLDRKRTVPVGDRHRTELRLLRLYRCMAPIHRVQRSRTWNLTMAFVTRLCCRSNSPAHPSNITPLQVGAQDQELAAGPCCWTFRYFGGFFQLSMRQTADASLIGPVWINYICLNLTNLTTCRWAFLRYSFRPWPPRLGYLSLRTPLKTSRNTSQQLFQSLWLS